jgi:hypothetical protein
VEERAILQPGQSASTEVGGLNFKSGNVDRVSLSIDFIEFENGSSWGPDTFKSAERLEGQREGARAASQYLLSLLKARGQLAVIEASKAESINISPPPNKTSGWLTGFHAGIDMVKARLTQSQKDGTSKIESILQKPLDASKKGRTQ